MASHNQLSSSCDLILTHYECQGTKMDSGRLVEKGISSSSGATTISGHIHTPQEVKNWIYCGSLVRRTFHSEDQNYTGGVLLYDLKAKTFERLGNPISKHCLVLKSLENIDSVSPEKFIVQCRTSQSREEIDKIFTDRNLRYAYLPQLSKVDESEKYMFVSENLSHDHLLKNYVNKNRPEVMNLLEELLKC